MPYITPPTVPSTRFCRWLSIPDDPHWLGIVSGALLELTYPYNWQQTDGITPTLAADTALAMVNEFWATSGCPTENDPPFWENSENVDDTDPPVGIPWYDTVADWFLTGFLAVTVTPLAGIFYITYVPKARLAFRRGEWGSLFKILINGIEFLTGDTYSAITDLLNVDIDFSSFAATHELGAPPYTLEIRHNGTGANPNPNPSLQVVRKRLDEEEVMAITALEQVGGQLRYQVGNVPTWLDVPNADNVRRDGSTVIVGAQKFRSGSADGLISVNPNVGERAIDVRLPVTTLQDVLRVVDSGGITKFRVDSSGRFQLRGTDSDQFLASDNSGSIRWRLDTRSNQTAFNLYASNGQTADILAVFAYAGHRSFTVSGSGGLYNYALHGLRLLSSTTLRDAFLMSASWLDGTDATRRAQVSFSVNDWTGSREFLHAGTSGSAPSIGFLGATPIIRPTVTGERQGNEALASLLTSLANLGLIVDNTTAGTAPFTPTLIPVYGERDQNPALLSVLTALEANGIVLDGTTPGTQGGVTASSLFDRCAVALGLRDTIMDDMAALINIAVVQWDGAPFYNIPQVVGDYQFQHDAEWFNSNRQDPYEVWLETLIEGRDGYEVVVEVAAWLADTDNRTEIARLLWCAITSGCVESFADQDNLVTAIRDSYGTSQYFEAVAAWIERMPLARVQYGASEAALCHLGESCDFLCETIVVSERSFPGLPTQSVYTTTFNTIVGAPYKLVVQGTTVMTSPDFWQYDAGFIRNNATGEWAQYIGSYGMRINGTAQRPSYSSEHKYNFFFTGNGTPATFVFEVPFYGSFTSTLTIELIGLA